MTNLSTYALVTGATKGIGQQIVMAFADAGCNVGMAARSEEDLLALQAKLHNLYPEGVFPIYPIDLSVRAKTHSLCNQLIQEEIKWAVLVNNAGVYEPAPLLSENITTWDTMWAVNVDAPMALIRTIVPIMQQNGRGHVFNICSIAARKPQNGSGTYSATKAALYSYTQSLRQETLGTGVQVTAIMPGQTWSSSWTGVDLPTDRLMQPEDISRAILNAWHLAPSAVVEELWIRPAKGDL